MESEWILGTATEKHGRRKFLSFWFDVNLESALRAVKCHFMTSFHQVLSLMELNIMHTFQAEGKHLAWLREYSGRFQKLSRRDWKIFCEFTFKLKFLILELFKFITETRNIWCWLIYLLIKLQRSKSLHKVGVNSNKLHEFEFSQVTKWNQKLPS